MLHTSPSNDEWTVQILLYFVKCNICIEASSLVSSLLNSHMQNTMMKMKIMVTVQVPLKQSTHKVTYPKAYSH